MSQTCIIWYFFIPYVDQATTKKNMSYVFFLEIFYAIFY